MFAYIPKAIVSGAHKVAESVVAKTSSFQEQVKDSRDVNKDMSPSMQ